MAADEVTPGEFQGWALLELMGHRKLAGYVAEVSIAGAGFLRIDVPGVEATQATQFYSPGAVYALTPISEDLARRFALRCQPEPVTRWELPPATSAQAESEDDAEDDQNESPRVRMEDLEDQP